MIEVFGTAIDWLQGLDNRAQFALWAVPVGSFFGILGLFDGQDRQEGESAEPTKQTDFTPSSRYHKIG